MEISCERPGDSGVERARDEAADADVGADAGADATLVNVRVLMGLVMVSAAELLLWLCRPPMPPAVGWGMLAVAVIAGLAATWLIANVLAGIPERHHRVKALEARNAADRARMATPGMTPGQPRHHRDPQ